MTDIHTENRTALDALRAAMRDFSERPVRSALESLFAPDAAVRLPHPLDAATGPVDFYDRAYAPLLDAWPDLERRDWIVMAGKTEHGDDWVGCGGHYVGTFVGPWMDIPPSGHLTHMRFHEFFRMEAGRIVEMQAVWDIPEVMMQAGAWPMAPSLGRELWVPGPVAQDGLETARDREQAAESCAHVRAMLDHLTRHPAQGGPEVMALERFWHPRMTWYGPAGIGTARGIAGFRNWHQIPFLSAMPDRGAKDSELVFHFFGDGPYVGVTGWPNMVQSVTGDGWLGIAPAGQRLELRSLDFWRLEDGLIRENWVLVDLLDTYRQLGVDVLARMREFGKARVPGRVPWPIGAP